MHIYRKRGSPQTEIIHCQLLDYSLSNQLGPLTGIYIYLNLFKCSFSIKTTPDGNPSSSESQFSNESISYTLDKELFPNLFSNSSIPGTIYLPILFTAFLDIGKIFPALTLFSLPLAIITAFTYNGPKYLSKMYGPCAFISILPGLFCFRKTGSPFSNINLTSCLANVSLFRYYSTILLSYIFCLRAIYSYILAQYFTVSSKSIPSSSKSSISTATMALAIGNAGSDLNTNK